MNNTEAELKAIAKVVKSSLNRDGHTVPHTVVLKALAVALNKRDWQTLKATVSGVHAVAEVAPATLPPLEEYDNSTRFFVRLAYFAGNPLNQLPETSADARTKALTAVGSKQSGVLRWQGWNMPADLNYSDSTVDAGDFAPDCASSSGTLVLRYAKGTVELEVGFAKSKGWYVSSKGAADFARQLEVAVPDTAILETLTPPKENSLKGPRVSATFHTDDLMFETEFDARPSLMECAIKDLTSIIEVGYTGDYCTDNLAEGPGDSNSIIQEAFKYIGSTQRGRNPIGFEVRVDGEQYLRWMDACHSKVLSNLLCERQGVDVFQTNDEGVEGRWDWTYAPLGEGSDMSLETREEAVQDAYRKLDLLSREIQDLDS